MEKQTLAVLMVRAVTAAALMGCSTKTAETAPETTTVVETTAALETIPEETTIIEVSTEAPGMSSDMTLRVGSLKGPTSMGLVSLMDQASKGEAGGSYEFTMVTAADELLTKVISGDLDIALAPANVASILYNRINHGINVIGINTLGILYVVPSDEFIQSVVDLKGKTLYTADKGTTPDYVPQYLLSENGLTTDDVTIEYKSEATEVAVVLKEQEGAIGLLPQPFVTVVMIQNESLKMVLGPTKGWEAIQGGIGGSLVTGVTICRSELLANPVGAETIGVFLVEHKAPAMFVIDNVAETADLVVTAGIIEKAPVAAKAIPYCSITLVDGEMMKSMLDGYLTVFFDQDPASVGETLSDDVPYYIP